MNAYKYTVADYYLPALINGDHSGMENNEIFCVNSFQKYVIEQHGHGHWSYDDSESDYNHCDICDLMANCVTIEWVVI